MSIPEHVIEAACEGIWSGTNGFGGLEGTWSEMTDEQKAPYRFGMKCALACAFASLWQPIESAGTQDWSSDSWTLPVKVATDDEGNPLFLVYYESKGSGYWRATKWMPLPLPKGSE